VTEKNEAYFLFNPPCFASTNLHKDLTPPSERKNFELQRDALREEFEMAFRNHRFSRLELLVGRQSLDILRDKHVVIFGIGGVGGYAAESLARTAIGKITLIDHDDVCATNVNRQIIANSETIGEKKAELMAQRIQKINPLVSVVAICEHHHPEKGNELLSRAVALQGGAKIDYVFDCIDTLIPKVDLLARCLNAKTPVISSMGAASKWDPSQIKVSDISKTKNDPLARQIRLKLREIGIRKGFKAVYSTEEPLLPEQTVPGTEWLCICPTIQKEFGACVHKRVMLGTISYLPPMFGLWMVSEVVHEWLKEIDFQAREPLPNIPTYEEMKRALSVGASVS
jgi:tRNA threonylcarbamoyladenosine dehydratase